LFFILTIITSFLFKTELGWWDNILSCFLGGMFFYINKDFIPLTLSIFITSAFLYLITSSTFIEPIVSPILKGYLIFYLAFIPKLNLPKINDYSFGIFLYHFFIQQVLIVSGITHKGTLFFLSLLISFVLSFISYHFIETRFRTKEIFILSKNRIL
jgi:peptidoglycan/LPS O-acetylase OafA/YrhL